MAVFTMRAPTLCAVLVAASLVALSGAFQCPSNMAVGSQVRTGATSLKCVPSLRRNGEKAAGLSNVHMGARDTLKKVAGAVFAAVTISVVPSRAQAAAAVAEPQQTEQDYSSPAQPQALMLPSQAAYMSAQKNKVDPVQIASRVVQDPRVLYVAGAAAVGGAGYVVLKNKEKGDSEKMRNMLKNKSGINIDASILDEVRINRPGAKTVQFTNAPKFGSYRPPPAKLMKDVKDKYVWKTKDSEEKAADDIADKIELDIFKKGKSGDIPNTNGDVQQKKKDLDAPEVEVVGDFDGPKTAAEKALEDEFESLSMDDVMAQAFAENGMDPAMMAATLPALQQQLQELMEGGISAEEVREVRKSFQEVGVDLDDMFNKIEEMEKAGLTDAMGPDGAKFFKTLKNFMNSA